MINRRRIYVLAITVLLSSICSSAVAASKVEKKLNLTKISLQEAVGIAEQAAGGKAYKAKLEKDSFGVEFEVDLLVGERKVEVSVDAQSGEILKVRSKKD